jgi:EAL domain-containing protein (putative c-di-GMP-specific phosphodiesterase class I)
MASLDTRTNDAALCEAIIVMAHKLGLKVVAEGVETRVQADLLARAHCDFTQGFLFSRPIPPEQLEAILKHGAQGR